MHTAKLLPPHVLHKRGRGGELVPAKPGSATTFDVTHHQFDPQVARCKVWAIRVVGPIDSLRVYYSYVHVFFSHLRKVSRLLPARIKDPLRWTLYYSTDALACTTTVVVGEEYPR